MRKNKYIKTKSLLTIISGLMCFKNSSNTFDISTGKKEKSSTRHSAAKLDMKNAEYFLTATESPA